ncbi:phage tail sheath subtilisin-like domain-containing protein [Halomonas alimentaria]|uniref:phage tail sheath subtilisin-like domain-containing protein n=1 Tax=Halomonas alimentaria TaxID=147248 RepID=UPI003CD0D0C8
MFDTMGLALLVEGVAAAGLALTYTAATPGTDGNAIRVRYVDPGSASATLAVTVSGNDITVTLATDIDSEISSTAAEIATAVNAEADASALVTATEEGDGTTDKKTGLQALLAAEQTFGVKPRILGAPELDDADVTGALIGIAQKLRGFVYASAGDSATKEGAAMYRENFGAREVMVICPSFTGWDTATSSPRTLSAVARAMGLRAKLDNEFGWHKTLPNRPVEGVSGISKDVFWDLQDPNTDAGYLNSHEVTAHPARRLPLLGLAHLLHRPAVRLRELHPHRPNHCRHHRRGAPLGRRPAHAHQPGQGHHRRHQRQVPRVDPPGLPAGRLGLVRRRAQHPRGAQGRQALHRLRLHAGAAAREPDVPAAHHRPLPSRLSRPRRRRLIAGSSSGTCKE